MFIKFISNMLQNCPHCGLSEKRTPEKEWRYGVKSEVKVERILCKCGKLFNFYQSEKSSWTIPKQNKVAT